MCWCVYSWRDGKRGKSGKTGTWRRASSFGWTSTTGSPLDASCWFIDRVRIISSNLQILHPAIPPRTNMLFNNSFFQNLHYISVSFNLMNCHARWTRDTCIKHIKALDFYQNPSVMNLRHIRLVCWRHWRYSPCLNILIVSIIVITKLTTYLMCTLRVSESLQLFDKFLWWAFKQTNTKLMEAQSKIGTLDAKIVKLMYALRREVGDHIPIDKVRMPDKPTKHLLFFWYLRMFTS